MSGIQRFRLFNRLKSFFVKIIEKEDLILQKQESIFKEQESISERQDIIISIQNQIIRNQQEKYDELCKQIQILSKKNDRYSGEFHKHIDHLYRDIMIALRYGMSDYWSEEANLHTDYPIAFDSGDTLCPHGTIRDNTRCPAFVRKCEKILGKDNGIRFLDLGCSGGGMVLEVLLRGHYGLGLEGCDISQKQQRAEWRLIPDHLKTCDITKPFRITYCDSDETMMFDIITAWEVMEHISEDCLEQLFNNITNHLVKGGLFVASIANYPDMDLSTGIKWHVTLHDKQWWVDKYRSFSFEVIDDLFDVEDYARGRYNPPNCYELFPDGDYSDNERSFHIVARKN